MKYSLVHRARSKYKKSGITGTLRSAISYFSSNISLYIWKARLKSTGRKYQYHGITLDLLCLDPVVQRNIVNGNYESGTLKNIDEYLSPNDDVIELGAGIGLVSCYIDRYLSNKSIQIVLEPNENIINELQKNAKTNDGDFQIINAAYSPNHDSVELTVDGAFWGGTTILDGDRTMTIDGINLENLTNIHGLAEFTLISNMEGAEYLLLYNEIDVLKEKCDKLMVGFHDVNGYSIEDAISHIEENGFRLATNNGNKKYVFENKRYCDT